jgi:hypothetical protein
LQHLDFQTAAQGDANNNVESWADWRRDAERAGDGDGNKAEYGPGCTRNGAVEEDGRAQYQTAGMQRRGWQFVVAEEVTAQQRALGRKVPARTDESPQEGAAGCSERAGADDCSPPAAHDIPPPQQHTPGLLKPIHRNRPPSVTAFGPSPVSLEIVASPGALKGGLQTRLPHRLASPHQPVSRLQTRPALWQCSSRSLLELYRCMFTIEAA